MLEASRLSFRAGKKLILDDVSVRLTPGRILAIAGPNGAGKSSLLKLLCAEFHPDSGTVNMDERPLASWPICELAKRRAVMGQHTRVDFEFTAAEVVLMGRSPHQTRGTETARDWKIASEAMQVAGVAHLAQRFFPVLSGGEQQRVRLAGALAQIWEAPKHRPRYLFLDEPTASLDLSHQHDTLRAAKLFAAQGTAVLVVLHDLNLVARYADEVLLLKQGRVFANGTPYEVLTERTIREIFDVEVAVRQDERAGLVIMVV